MLYPCVLWRSASSYFAVSSNLHEVSCVSLLNKHSSISPALTSLSHMLGLQRHTAKVQTPALSPTYRQVGNLFHTSLF